MTDNSVLLEKRGQAYWITINRPDKRNALNGGVIAGIARGYREAHDDKDVRVIVLTGTGDKAFCAGADLSSGADTFDRDARRGPVKRNADGSVGAVKKATALCSLITRQNAPASGVPTGLPSKRTVVAPVSSGA